MILQTLFNNEFGLFRVVRTSDLQGGWAETLELQGTFRGRLYPIGGLRRRGLSKEYGESQEVQISHILYTNSNEDVRKGDFITLRTITLEAMMVREPSGAQHHLEIECIERQNVGALVE